MNKKESKELGELIEWLEEIIDILNRNLNSFKELHNKAIKKYYGNTEESKAEDRKDS